MDVFLRILCVGAAGAAGALARWGVMWSVEAIAGRRVESWPWATLAVNSLGCFAFGLCLELFRHRAPLDEFWRPLVFVGFLASFTTYSTFAFDTVRLHGDQHFFSALGYVFIHVLVGWVTLLAGLYLGRVVA